jgi:3-isopropylmalate/(R)-2-methylmalate dehydratase large subunit
MPQTLLDKIWDSHLVARRGDGRDLIYMDRHLLHERHAPRAFEKLAKSGRAVRRPDLTFAVQDHSISTLPGRDDFSNPEGTDFLQAMRAGSRKNAIRLFDLGDPEQGISHVVAPELGMVLPGATHVVPDSHACTVGGVGALAFGCGTTELEHVLVTQVMAMSKPKSMRIRLDGELSVGVSALDVALHIVRVLGIDCARGHAIEYTGDIVRSMSIESRFTLCNMAVEMGARTGLVPADDTTFAWLAGRPWAPQNKEWETALATWRLMVSDSDAVFDRDTVVDCTGLQPQITWGTNQAQVINISDHVPELSTLPAENRAAAERALDYMALTPGAALAGLPIQRVFIGSCTAARLSDLHAAAAIARGRHVADGVVALISPGSTTVRRQAEAAGLHTIFKDAGFLWGESGCSMCGAGNGDMGRAGERCVSTTSRNFEGRQGRLVRTHLASPQTAAAAAIAGHIVDHRQFATEAT